MRKLLVVCIVFAFMPLVVASDRNMDFEDDYKSYGRSCVVYFENKSRCSLRLTQSWFSFTDCFTDCYPPPAIPSGKMEMWASYSGGIGGRAKGSAFYTCTDCCSANIVVKWNVPFIGYNGYKFRSSGNHVLEKIETIDGSNAVVRFILRDAELTPSTLLQEER